MNKIIVGMVAVAVVFGGAGYYVGTKHVPARGQGFQQARIGGQFMGRQGVNGGFTAGDIIAKDATSVTVKLRDNSSKIVFFSGTTEVGKMVVGTPSDLEIGKTVTVTGTTNTDGSVTATSIQLRPAFPSPSPTSAK